jgi:O-acetyl-ADP-ribose deacetylase (regulator of RNase III)
MKNNHQIEIVKGDITQQPDIEAIVNAANAELAPGGGVAGAIHSVAGPELYKETKSLAPIKPGECVITKAYNLPNKYVIHCLGPRYGIDEPAKELLTRCYVNAIKLANEQSVSSIAFPSISTGAFGYPIEQAATVAIHTVKEILQEIESVKLVRFVLFRESDLNVFKKAFEKVWD